MKAGFSGISVFVCVWGMACVAGAPMQPAGASFGGTSAGDKSDNGPGPDATPADAGTDGTGLDPDAGTDPAGPPPGPSPDAGSGEEPGMPPPPPTNQDEAGDVQQPRDVTLPFETETDLVPEGDSDCYRFVVEHTGLLRAETSNVASSMCFDGDTELFLYSDGAESEDDAIASNDDGGDGTCSLLEFTLNAGTYVVCVQHYSSVFPEAIYGATLVMDFTPYICGNGEIDPGEECDGDAQCDNCQLNDGLVREDEEAGNDLPTDDGVKRLELNVAVRGRITSASDVDWWRLELPGGFQPGAVVVRLGPFDLASQSCGAEASAFRIEAFGAADFETPEVESFAASPCRELVVTGLNGDILFGDETLFIRVRSQNRTGAYHVVAEYVEGDCGNGAIEPSEECDPATSAFADSCDPNLCRWTTPPNNTCAGATDISSRFSAEGGTTTLVGQTFSATRDTSWTGGGTCQSAAIDDHKDVHYTFIAPIDGVLVANLRTSWDSVLYAFEGECESPMLCSDPGVLHVRVVAGQRYTLVVDAYGSASGAFDLDLELLPNPENDRCESAQDLTGDIPPDGTILSVSSTTVSAVDDFSWGGGGCAASGSTAPDVYYTFTAVQDGQVFISLAAAGWEAVVYALQADCNTRIRCEDSPTELLLDVSAGETYRVAVDGYGTTHKGRFELRFHYAVPPPNDLCGAEEARVLPDDGTSLTIRGSTEFAQNDGDAGLCTQGSGEHRDTFHTFVAPRDGEIFLKATGINWSPLVYARTRCDAMDELGCASAPAELTVPVVGGEEVYVGIDAYSSTGGHYTLSATFRVPPPFIPGGDTCFDAAPLPGPSGTLRGSLDDADPDYDSDELGECANGFASAGPDVVYSIELSQGQTLRVEYIVVGSNADESLLLLDACPPQADSCVEGSDNAYAGAEIVEYTHQSATPKIYYIVADEYGYSSWERGTFELTWEVTDSGN